MTKTIGVNNPMVPGRARVISVRAEIKACMSICVEPLDDHVNAGFTPGQFYMLYVFGHGEVPISVSGDPAQTGRLTFTVMNVGSVTAAICDLKPGDVLGLRGPFGTPWPVAESRGQDVLVIAGGLGLAPLRPFIYQVLAARQHYGRVMLVYGSRRPETLLYPDELLAWQYRGLELALTVDAVSPDGAGLFSRLQPHVGVVTDLVSDMCLSPSLTVALTCGPEVMMRFVARRLLDEGLAAQQIFVSMERNMKCAIARCGRCQYGPHFICKDGPVFTFDRVQSLFAIREV